MKIEKICPVCNKTYFVYPSEENKYIYCSVECRKLSKRINKICIECGKKYFVYKDRVTSLYCSDACQQKNKQNALIIKQCPSCGINFTVRQCEDKKYTHCSMKCKSDDSNVEYHCDYCGKLFLTRKWKIDNNKRGVYCSSKCSEKSQIKGKFVYCESCGKIVFKSNSDLNTYKHVFCSNQCHADFDNKSIERVCKFCGKKYTVKFEHINTTKFCSMKCKNDWQASEANRGVNNKQFKRLLIKCGYCDKTFYVKNYILLEDGVNHFCCADCRNKYYQIADNRTEKQKRYDALVGKKAGSCVKSTLTVPHKKIMNILDKNDIKYTIEYPVDHYKLDIHLTDFNLTIEVQGDFWHCSPLKFSTIKYTQQFQSIKRDKSKRTYIKKYYNHEILFLWEKDILKDPMLCEKLIDMYIKNNGILKNYQSFNYKFNDNNVFLIDKIIRPYQDMPIEEMRKYINIKNVS